jgi:hypothetical protein
VACLVSMPSQHFLLIGCAVLLILRFPFNFFIISSHVFDIIVWSLATLGFGITEEQSSRSSEHLARQYIYLPSDDPENDRNLMEESVKTVLDQVKKNHRVYRNQELNNLCWAMARLGWKDDEMFEIVGYELLSPKRRDLKGQDLSTSLWSMATLGYSNDTLYRDLTRRACEIGAANFNAQEIRYLFNISLWIVVHGAVLLYVLTSSSFSLLSSPTATHFGL